MELSVDALLSKDEGKAEAVIASDAELDAMEIELESAALELLALQQPMARDLRFIVSVIKVTSDLERVGDHAVNIAQASLRLIAQRANVTRIPIEDLRDARGHARRLHSAPYPRDGALAVTCARDDQGDAPPPSRCSDPAQHDGRPAHIKCRSSTAREPQLEGVAELATNIGEDRCSSPGQKIKPVAETRETAPPAKWRCRSPSRTLLDVADRVAAGAHR